MGRRESAVVGAGIKGSERFPKVASRQESDWEERILYDSEGPLRCQDEMAGAGEIPRGRLFPPSRGILLQLPIV